MTAESEGLAAARKFRADHHLGTQPLGDLVTIIEHSTGIDVAVLDANLDTHGLTVRDPASGAVFIGVARSERPMRQRSTLAHELAHVLFEDWADATEVDLTDRKPSEIRADAFARHLLVPIEGLRETFGDHASVDLKTLSSVVQGFLVSPPIAAIALQQAGYISEPTKRDWMGLATPQLATRFGWSDQYLALSTESNQRRAPQRLLRRATQGYVERVVSVQTLANLRGIDADVMQSELIDAGLVPGEEHVQWADASDLPDVDVDLSDLEEEPEQDTAT